MFTTKRRQRRDIEENRGDGGVEISLCTGVPDLIVALDAAQELYTVLCTIVGRGGAFFFRGFRPSTSAIMSLTAFAVPVTSKALPRSRQLSPSPIYRPLPASRRCGAPTARPMATSGRNAAARLVQRCPCFHRPETHGPNLALRTVDATQIRWPQTQKGYVPF